MEINLYAPGSEADPYPTYAWLRREAPVYREEQEGTWVLSRFEDVYGALRDYATYSSAQGITPAREGAMTGSLPLFTEDPPAHTALRRIVNTAFTPRQVRELTPSIEQVAADLLDAIETDSVEIVEALTVPLPVIVISRMLGIPEEDRERFKVWSAAVTGVVDAGPASTPLAEMEAERRATIVEMLTFFAQVVCKRHAEPKDDLISLLVQAEIEGERMTDVQLVGFCVLLLAAGNEPTTNLIGNALNILLDRPELWARLREDRSLVEGVLEETLRFDSPVQMLWRTVTRPVSLHGVDIPKGDMVMLAFASANRDAAEFPDPDTFNPERDWSSHLAFSFGTHYCLGAPLARVEANVALNAMLDRYPTIERGEGEPLRVGSSVLRGFATLPLRLGS